MAARRNRYKSDFKAHVALEALLIVLLAIVVSSCANTLSERTQVPYVVGMQEQSAINKIKSRGFVVRIGYAKTALPNARLAHGKVIISEVVGNVPVRSAKTAPLAERGTVVSIVWSLYRP